MKHIVLSLFAAMMISGGIQAAGVSQQSAQTIAVNFFKLQVPAASNASLTARLNYTRTETDGSVDFYVFDMSPVTGFVIISGDNTSVPVIAYSSESHFNANGLQTGVVNWMNAAAKKIHYAVTNNIHADSRIQNMWSSYAQGLNPHSQRSLGAVVGPLLTTTWNQEPYYNSLCPFDAADNERCVTGCVATAMAQILKYWNYPAAGTGSYSYSSDFGTLSANFSGPFNWAAMPANVSSDSSAVDTLMYQCGVSVAMYYGDDLHGGSGAFVLQSDIGQGNPCAQHSYVTYFKYNPNTIQGVYMSSYATQDWIALMENELNSGRVIQYEGDDPNAGGHTWVCDGYDANDFLHMNWGWGGADDGFYSVDDLDAGGYTFSQNDAALIGIEPILPVSLSLSVSSPAICPGGNTTLLAQGPASATYTWTPVTGLSCTSCSSPVASPGTSTLYTVTVDSGGVQSSLSQAVVVNALATAAFGFTSAPSCTLPEDVVFNNTSANATNYLWDFGDGTTSTDASPVHQYADRGNYTVSLITSNSCGADTMTGQTVQIQGGAPVMSCANICPGESVTITATGAGSISWYDAPDQADLMSIGSSYVTPNLTNTITYYVSSSIMPAPATAGAVNNTIGSGTYGPAGGLIFNNTVEQTLVSVVVFASGAGSATFYIQDAGGTVISSVNVNLTNGEQTVPLNLSIPVGNNLQLTESGVDLYNNSSGAVFPYTSSDGSLVITNNNQSVSGLYYNFYSWQLQQPGCNTAYVPVSVYVLGTGGNAINAYGSGSPTVSFAPGDTVASTFAWSFGDGSTSTEEFPTHTYTTGGDYTVQLIVSNDTCSDTTTRTISTVQLGLNNLPAVSSFSVYPNPAKGNVYISLNSGTISGGCELKIEDALGQTVYSSSIDLVAGSNEFGVDISALAPGIYFVCLQNGSGKMTSKFVKEGDK